jgi:hypothetical protein
MKNTIPLLLAAVLFAACNNSSAPGSPANTSLPLAGTWQLISGTTIEKGDTTVTYYTKDLAFIKVINDSHFAFLKHDLTKGKDSTTRAFGAGGGSYLLKDSTYTEHLEYCSDREWEGNDFSFTVHILHDTLVQSGIEKVESAGINRVNIERYVRVKK